ncbi:MAG: aminotransferase class V-fold PLP-dependent enzyme [Gemmatimonadota bacterium]|nr:aminotransferase class V-fold PLP-dependent enzyme [Gemmatimonadota bacterium]MDH5282760.1 aminotransferase class V-fold PLP-dependent enzyme [Gemmatimonadota bacterium]
MPYDVMRLRRQEFSWADETIYLDHAAIGPLPERTRLACDQMNLRRSRPYELGHEFLFGALAEARVEAAGLIGAEPGEIALTTNTSIGLGLAARALPFEPGDVVLASDREFPANVYPWKRLGDRGVTLELVPCTAQGWPDEERLLARLAGPRVRCVAVSLTQFANGYTVDLARLSAETRARGQFLVVDAIQALGQIPVDVAATPVDVLACGAQKWLLAPWGSGFVYVRRELIPALEPAITGWMAFEGTDDFTRLTHYREELRADARRFELISLPFQDFVGMIQSVRLLRELGVGMIQAHLATLRRPIVEWAARRAVPVTSPTGRAASGIVCIAPPRLEESFRALRAGRVICGMREGSIRLSPHCYNTVAEMERVTDLLERSLA